MLHKSKRVAAVFICCVTALTFDYYFTEQFVKRNLSVDLGNGNCEWTGAEKIDLNQNPHGTLLASYPGAGMRLTWQMTEGASGIQVGDDFFYSGRMGGLVKTQYPHPEGIWSWGTAMDQTVLLIRNPRWNIPSYHTLIFELEYAHDYVVAYDNVFTAFSRRAPIDNWLKWRDYRFHDEIDVWGWYIDFWMGNGTQFWDPLDFERAGQYPFRYYKESEKPWPKDAYCRNDLDCVPKAVVSYERMRDPLTGPEELRKIVDLIRYKKGMAPTVSDEAINCIWQETWDKAPEPRNEDRDSGGILADEYDFTIEQMEQILAKLIFYKHRYSTGDNVLNLQARDLVLNFHDYINEVTVELGGMYANPPPTMAPSTQKELVDWYNTLGRGNRYAKDIVQHMASYWPVVEDIYNQTTEAPTACPAGSGNVTQIYESLTETEKEWLDEHNSRRTTFFALNGLEPNDLVWSQELAASAQGYADKLAAEDGCWVQHRLGGDVYGTQNLALDRGVGGVASPSEVLQSWHDEEVDLTTMELIGLKFHASQVLFRSSNYVGCATSSKEDPDYAGSFCHFHVCRYLGPGNCFLEALVDVYPSFLALMPPNCMDNHPDNYWLCSTISDYASTVCQLPPDLPVRPSDACEL